MIQTTTDPTIPTLFATERARRGIDQRQFAAALGLPNHQVIDQWEDGAKPSTDILIRILIQAPEMWAQQLAARALHLRYPGVFKNPKPD
jgi:transcriptional regulator with XRE-family HTH domain